MNSIRTRILLFFTLFGVVSALAVFISSWRAHDIGAASSEIVANHLPMVHAMGEMRVALSRQDNALYQYLATRDRVWLSEFEKQRQDYLHWFGVAQSHASHDLEVEKFNDIDEWYVQYDNETRQALLTAEKTTNNISKMISDSGELLEKIHADIDRIVFLRQGMTTALQAQISTNLSRNRLFSLWFPLMLVAFFYLLAMYLWRFLVRPISLLLEGIRDFARGETDVRLPSLGKDELGELQEAFNEMSREVSVERKRLRSESQSDSLTGLFNMRYFRVQLSEEFSRSQRYSHPLTLLMIDVDYFKSYNDRNGHPAGDIVLKEVARILIRNVRGTDVVARYGGEEFVILLPETPVESAIHVAEKIRHTVENHHFPFRETQVGAKLTVSVGVGAYPDKFAGSDQDLVEAADKALYGAKKNGRNQVFVHENGNVGPPKSSKSAKRPLAS